MIVEIENLILVVLGLYGFNFIEIVLVGYIIIGGIILGVLFIVIVEVLEVVVLLLLV